MTMGAPLGWWWDTLELKFCLCTPYYTIAIPTYMVWFLSDPFF